MNPLCLLPFLCAFIPLQPAPLVPDGQGGWVPVTNSRYNPATGQFLPPPPPPGYYPAGGAVFFLDPQEYQELPPDAYPQGTVTIGPQEPYQAPPVPQLPQPRHHAAKPPKATGTGCYGPDGVPVTPVPSGCQPQPPLPERTL
jgi:hypothetical protein